MPVPPGVARSSSREASRGACPPRSRRAARRARRSLAPVTGRASTCSTACSPSPSAAAAPASARSGSEGRPVRSGRISARASRSVPPVASTPAGSAGAAGQVVTACAPGQAASTARSTRPGGMRPGTHMLICSPPPAPPVQEYSQPRCGWPCHQRAQAGRSSPVRCPHSASAPAGSACGGARMTTCRAPSASTW